MSALRVKSLVGAVTLIGAIAFLVFAGARDGGWVYFVDVDKFVTDAQLHNQRVRLHGKVSTDGFVVNSGKLAADFTLQGHTQSLPISYRGSVPDMFKTLPDVAVAGAWAEIKGVQLNPKTALDGKTKELMGLAVASQIPCQYCIYFHTEAAKLNGATDEEIKEAIAMAAIVRHWSTIKVSSGE